MNTSARKIAVIGLGYVGLPAAVAFGRSALSVTGFDTRARRRPLRKNLQVHERRARLATRGFLHRYCPDTDRREQAAQSGAIATGIVDRWPSPEDGSNRRLRVNGLPRRHRGRLHPRP